MIETKKAIIIGAGPAGLTAAYELIVRTNVRPIVYEADTDVGGIAKTVEYKGNRIDMGPHRFFSKSDKVIDWWLNILPLDETHPDSEKTMLVKKRKSSIYFDNKFFDYPIVLNFHILRNLGFLKLAKFIVSYVKARLFPIRNEEFLENFLINRFGEELYRTFFKSYTEKVWGVPCGQISADWGAQRVKGLSISSIVKHFITSRFVKSNFFGQENTETSLISKFMYPKCGSGQLWREVAGIVEAKGGEVKLRHRVVGIKREGLKIISVSIKDLDSGMIREERADYFISSMPVQDLVSAFGNDVPDEVARTARGLQYRDFMIVGLLLRKLVINSQKNGLVPDNWIYIQNHGVRLGRVVIVNNWSPCMVKDPDKVWLGLEYFCNEGDELWNMPEKDFIRLAIDETAKIGFIDPGDVLDHVVIRQPKAYPAYFGAYDHFDIIRNYFDKFDNLFLIGRNGMHRYNNMDHSMLTAMAAADNIINNVRTKDNIWAVNAEKKFHEERIPG